VTERVTIDTVDTSKPHEDWRPLLADAGRRRYLSYNLDFDTRALMLDDPEETWDEQIKIQHNERRDRLKLGLAQEFGEHNLETKIANFRAIGTKPFSVTAYHNAYFDQVRRAFVIGAYYPALVGACALGERILNHLIIDLRESYRNTPQYRQVYRKSSFDNWEVPIATLSAWNILLPGAAAAFTSLMPIRHRSIHFNPSTYETCRDDALSAIMQLREIIDQQFTVFGLRPWFIEGTRGFIFIKKSWEDHPYIRAYFHPTMPFVGPHFAISFTEGLRYHDHSDYGDGDWSDAEFAEVFEARTPEQCVQPDA
jgi:hypothetical protein